MTKAELVEEVYEAVAFSKKDSAHLVDLVFETIKQTLEEGEKLKVSVLAILWCAIRNHASPKPPDWRGN